MNVLAKVKQEEDLVAIGTWLQDLGDDDKEAVIYFCTFSPTNFKYPKFDGTAAFELDRKLEDIKLLENDANLMRRILAIRAIISDSLGKEVIREGLAMKAARINKLCEIADGIDLVIETRKKEANKLKGEVAILEAELDNLESTNAKSDDDVREIAKLKQQIRYINTVITSGFETGLVNGKGAFDTGLISELRKTLNDIASEMGDIVKNSKQVKIEVKKTYSDSAMDLLIGNKNQ